VCCLGGDISILRKLISNQSNKIRYTSIQCNENVYKGIKKTWSILRFKLFCFERRQKNQWTGLMKRQSNCEKEQASQLHWKLNDNLLLNS
jgi:hypothetical protein